MKFLYHLDSAETDAQAEKAGSLDESDEPPPDEVDLEWDDASPDDSDEIGACRRLTAIRADIGNQQFVSRYPFRDRTPSWTDCKFTYHIFLKTSCAFRVRSRKMSQNTRMNLDLECSIQK